MLQYSELYSIRYIVPLIDRSSIFLSVASVSISLALSTSFRLLPCVFILLSLAGVTQLLAGDSVIRLLFISIYTTNFFTSPILAQALTKSIVLPIVSNAFLLFIILILSRETGVKLRIELNVVFLPLKDILPFIDSDPVALTRYKGDLSLADYFTLSFLSFSSRVFYIKYFIFPVIGSVPLFLFYLSIQVLR